ncbi:hypothetical protein HYALB_00006393 [Hymenoscyphus albidus]|uniref:sn-1-specific diacylglycerol lipase n=1 Tax=Hymenoscyphus albidus TaxID=595503 RepID=A0A9N9LIZ9_9HELO|nr:hypothetical protein HYALB_00006393 [Hymenoscyphus albidus]
MEQQDDEENNQQALELARHCPNATGTTLLPEPIANVVTLVTRSSSIYIRLGTFIAGLALDGARITTLTSLELSRALVEAILLRSGREVSARSIGEVGRAEAESILDKSVATLHRTITGISFAASTGFHLSSAALHSATDLSQQLLGALDSILGSTDSSRAIASIITLIRREFQNPATGREGEKVGVADLLSGITGLALLQSWCIKSTNLEIKAGRQEDVVWDVVILDNGRRADVVGNIDRNSTGRTSRPESMSFVSTTGGEVLETIERDESSTDESEEDLPEIHLRRRIMKSLPSNASVSITTSTVVTKTISVEITGAEPPDLSPPPGVEVIEDASNATDAGLEGIMVKSGQKVAPKYRVVYQIKRDALRTTNVKPDGPVEEIDHGIRDGRLHLEDVPPRRIQPLELRSPRTPSPERRKSVPSILYPQTPPSGPTYRLCTDAENQTPTPTPPSSLAPKDITGTYLNQKRPRKPMSSSSSISGTENQPPKKVMTTKAQPVRKTKTEKEKPPPKPPVRKSSFRSAIKKGPSSTISHLLNKEPQIEEPTPPKPPPKPQWGAPPPNPPPKSYIPVPLQASNLSPLRDAPRPPQRGNPNYFTSRDLGFKQSSDMPPSPSRASYYSIQDQQRGSVISQSETYSIHSADTRPSSPSAYRTHLRNQSSLMRARSEKNFSHTQMSPHHQHRRSKSYVPSIYTLKTDGSSTSLVLAPTPQHSAFEDYKTLETMARTGHADGMFPQHHIVRNITRFVRFASASYGASFLRVMGITASNVTSRKSFDPAHHYEHHSFSSHTQLPPDTILLSSFVDPQGGTDSSGNTDTGVPMVHFVSLDHESKAVVLTCRGTLGFEDVLTDLTCDYDEMNWRGQNYSVHKGIHASARRLLNGRSSRVMATITAALEEFPEYGLVLCGHSLGAGVSALLAIMISEPASDPSTNAFVTSSASSPQLLLTARNEHGTAPANLHLPAGRPIHVYAYGPPSTLSSSLRLATRGLITTIVNGQDLVPYLSLGILHDLQAVALAFKTDDSGAKGEFRTRVWAGITNSIREKWYAGSGSKTGAFSSGVSDPVHEDQWAYSALKVLRACMLSPKLVPPGEVFVVETCPVLKRDAFVDRKPGESAGSGLGRPATRAVLKYIRDVDRRFGEVVFGGSMLLDHSPARYEASLGALGRGVLG